MCDENELSWKRSLACNPGDCVEVAKQGDEILVRDSKAADGPVLRFGGDEWEKFVTQIKSSAR